MSIYNLWFNFRMLFTEMAKCVISLTRNRYENALVVQKLDSTIYPLDSNIQWIRRREINYVMRLVKDLSNWPKLFKGWIMPSTG